MAARRLAALMFTDMVGYSTLAGQNEELARELVDEHRQLIRKRLSQYGGHENQTTGDGFFVEFPSVLNAVQCGIEIQTLLRARNLSLPDDRRIKIRIGIHLSDILSDSEDSYGDGVNIAARIESLAPSGGICISQQVFDQVQDKLSGVEIRKIGQRSLKNIRGGAVLYRLVFPWEKKESKFLPDFQGGLNERFRNTSVNAALVGSLFFVCFGIFGLSTHLTWKGIHSGEATGRTSEPRRLDLSPDWSFVLDSNRRSPGDLPSAPTEHWEAFDPHHSWKFADTIQGRYWLKKTFEIRYPFQYPAIVLGLIADSHRVYLNGRFIGGSDTLGDLAYYVFDPSLLNLEGPNTILVSARSRPTLDPGLTWIPEIGSFVGEFEDVRRTVASNQVQFHILRSVYLALSLVLFSACFIIALFNRSHRNHQYHALYLLLGSLLLAYYNPWVHAAMDYSLLRFVKVISLILSTFVLHSAFLHQKERYRSELFNNGAAVGATAVIAYFFLFRHQDVAAFIQSYNYALQAAALFTCGWVITAVFTHFSKPRSSNSINVAFEYLYIGFGLIGLLSIAAALKSATVEMLITPSARRCLQDISIAIPFAFSVCKLLASTLDYIVQTRTAIRKESRDQLVLNLIRLIHGSTDVTGTVGKIQERVSRFLKSRRSTLYVLEEDEGNSTLKATYILGDERTKIDVKRSIKPEDGIIGYACMNRSPILISDIRKDPRFAKQLVRSKSASGYRTGACMIFPLISGSRLLGVLTFADKEDDLPFTQDDFAIALEVSTDLALLLDSRQIQASLWKKVRN